MFVVTDAVKPNLSNNLHSSEINGIVNVIRLFFFLVHNESFQFSSKRFAIAREIETQ